MTNNKRTGEIIRFQGGYIIRLFEDGERKKEFALCDKSIHYIEEILENWENGILN